MTTLTLDESWTRSKEATSSESYLDGLLTAARGVDRALNAALSSPTTSGVPNTIPVRTFEERMDEDIVHTVAAIPNDPLSTHKAVLELRRLSGLTWDQLGKLLNVSRRSVHAWSNGQTLSDENEAHLRRVLDVVRTADRGLSRFNRAALLNVVDGRTVLDLLANGAYEDALERLGIGIERPGRDITPLSQEEQQARTPPSPEDLLNERFDRIQTNHEETRVGRAWRPTESE